MFWSYYDGLILNWIDPSKNMYDSSMKLMPIISSM